MVEVCLQAMIVWIPSPALGLHDKIKQLLFARPFKGSPGVMCHIATGSWEKNVSKVTNVDSSVSKLILKLPTLNYIVRTHNLEKLEHLYYL